MSNYGFNPDELIDTKVELIDKDGFHKVGEVSDGGSSTEPYSNGMFFKEGLTIWMDYTPRYSMSNAEYIDIEPRLMSSIITKYKSTGNSIDTGNINNLYVYKGDAIDDSDIEIDTDSAVPICKSTNESIGYELWYGSLSTGGDIQKDGYAMNIGNFSLNDMSAEFIETYSGAQVHVIACCYSGEFVQFHNVQMPEIGDVIHD